MGSFRRLIRNYIKRYRSRFIQAMICMIVVGALTAILMYAIKPIMDRVFVTADLSLLGWVAAGIVVLSLIKGIFNYIQAYLLSYIGQRVIWDLRNDVFSHLQKLSLNFYLMQDTGSLMSRLTNDVHLIERAVSIVPAYLIKDGFTLICLCVVLFFLNWKWAIISLFVFPLIIYPILKVGSKIRRSSLEGQRQMGGIYSFLQEKISGIMIIKAFCQEEEEIKKMNEENKKFFNIIMHVMRAIALQRPLMEFISTFGIIGVLLLGGYQVVQGNATLGTFFAFLGSLSSLYAPVKNFASANEEIQRAAAASERIFEILDTKIFVNEKPDAFDLPPLSREIEIENVSFYYTPGNLVLKNISLRVKKGEKIALVGPSGAGKTTLVNLICRFYDPTSGRIKFDGIDIRDVTFKSLRRQIGIVTQDTILFNDTIRNNIAYGKPDVSDEEIIRAAKIANVYDFIVKLPYGFNTVVGERGINLSGGQKQRVAIARAIISDPRILIFDEATSSLDTESELLIQQALDNLLKGRTAFIIAHRLSTIRKADKIVVIENGEIVEVGTHKELITKKGTYEKLYSLQFIE